MIWLFLDRRSLKSHQGGCVNRPTESRRWCSLRYVSETHLGEVTYVPLSKWYINCLEPVSPKHSDSYQCSISRTVLCRSQYRELFAALTNSCVQVIPNTGTRLPTALLRASSWELANSQYYAALKGFNPLALCLGRRSIANVSHEVTWYPTVASLELPCMARAQNKLCRSGWSLCSREQPDTRCSGAA